MSLGALLGGMAYSAGKRSQEAADRARESKQLTGKILLDHWSRNYDTLDQPQREMLAEGIESSLGLGKGKLAPMIGLGEQFYYNILPPLMQRNAQSTQGPNYAQAQPQTLTSIPSGEGAITTANPKIQMPEAPASIEMGEIPSPAQIGTGSIPYAPPVLAQVQRTGLSDVPAIRRQQMEEAMADRQRARQMQQLEQAPIPEEWKTLGYAQAAGVQGVGPYEAAKMRAEQQERALAAKMGELKPVQYVVPGSQPGTSHTITVFQDKYGNFYDQKTRQPITLAPEAEPLKQGYQSYVDDQGNATLVKPQQAIGPGNWRADLPGVGKKTQPRSMGGGRGANTPEDLDALVEAIIANPALFSQLTPTIRSAVTPKLHARGFTAFGKPMSDTNIKEITQSESAIGGVKDLLEIVRKNPDAIGPIAGIASFNPYSEVRQIKADMDRVRQRVGKALEGGVLRKEDEQKYKYILATVFDVPETAEYKLSQLIKDIERDIGLYKSNLAQGGRAKDLRPGTTVPMTVGSSGPTIIDNREQPQPPSAETPEQRKQRLLEKYRQR